MLRVFHQSKNCGKILLTRKRKSYRASATTTGKLCKRAWESSCDLLHNRLFWMEAISSNNSQQQQTKHETASKIRERIRNGSENTATNSYAQNKTAFGNPFAREKFQVSGKKWTRKVASSDASSTYKSHANHITSEEKKSKKRDVFSPLEQEKC